MQPAGLRGGTRQLAFNLAVGNADAHAKNYSVLLGGGSQVRLAPLYDTLPIFLWPQYDQLATMPIGTTRRPGDLTVFNWVAFAHKHHLDPDRLLAEVLPVVDHVRERLPDILREVGLDDRAVDLAAAHVKTIPATSTGDARANVAAVAGAFTGVYPPGEAAALKAE